METKDDLKNNIIRYISLRIKEKREQVGLTQGQLAEAIGMTRTSITNIESGKTHVQLVTLVDIAYKLGVKLDYFLPQELLSDKEDKNKIDYTPFFSEDINKEDVDYISDLIDNI